MTYIEVKSWGDFDVPTPNCIMVHTEEYSKKDLMTEFCSLMDIESEDGNSYREQEKLTKNFISFLELKGFTKLKTETVLFSD